MAPLLAIESLRVLLDLPSGAVPAVDGVSLQLTPGGSLALVGESGCGKTLLARAALRLLPSPPARVAAGRVLWRGEDLLTLPEARMRERRGRELALVFQEAGAALNPVLTLGSQLVEAIRSHESLSRRAATERATRLLGEVGMPEPRERLRAYPHQLSGGMRQRAMIALALSAEPALLIADEPTTALDVSIRAQIVALLQSIRASRAMALWLITHDLALVGELAEVVAVMYAGCIVEQAPTAALLTTPRHPYTVGLLASLPERQAVEPGSRLAAIPGQVPAPGQWPSGCRFRDRCARADAQCAASAPALVLDSTAAHSVACHHPYAGSEAQP